MTLAAVSGPVRVTSRLCGATITMGIAAGLGIYTKVLGVHPTIDKLTALWHKYFVRPAVSTRHLDCRLVLSRDVA